MAELPANGNLICFLKTAAEFVVGPARRHSFVSGSVDASREQKYRFMMRRCQYHGHLWHCFGYCFRACSWLRPQRLAGCQFFGEGGFVAVDVAGLDAEAVSLAASSELYLEVA